MIRLDLLDFDFRERVDAVLAIMVLLHFTREQCRNIIQHIAAILPVGGLFALAVKK